MKPGGCGAGCARLRALCLGLAVAGSFCPGTAVAAPPAFTRQDSLFLTAATGEPRFQSARDSCERVLVSEGAATLEYLVAISGRDRTPRQRHYIERLFTLVADSGRNPAARERLARAASEASSDTARAQWLYVGSRIGDSAFRAAAAPWLASGSEPVRRMAARVLGAYPSPGNIPLLMKNLENLRGLELHQRLWALDAHPPREDWGFLVPLLRAPEQYNRQKARDMLLRATDSAWSALRAAMPASLNARTRREWRLLALNARGGREFLESEAGAMTRDERVFYGLAPSWMSAGE